MRRLARPTPGLGRRTPRLRLVHLSWLPIRIRLTIAFASVMAVVLAVLGAALYAQFGNDLDNQMNSALLSQAKDVKALIEFGRHSAINGAGLGLAQDYDASGRVVESSLKAAHLRLLTTAEAVRATRLEQDLDRRALATGAVAIRAIPAVSPNGPVRAVAVADPLKLRDHELSHLLLLLLIAGPLALLLASVAGHELAGAALRPVDHMRAQAERITEHQLAERLPGTESADEIGALGRTLNAMLDRLQAAVMRERRVVGDASHELRTPLTTLRAELDLALMRERSPEEIRAALRSAADEARRMSRLADDLLVLARADQGRLPLDQLSLASDELLEAAAARAGAAVRMQGRTIAVQHGGADGAVVRGDSDRIAQMLDNLIANALSYGGGSITLSAQAQHDAVELHVTDEGPGFQQDFIGQAFERFARGEDARRRGPGTGLGLSLVVALASAHGGDAGVRNRPEGGADVWISLPLDQPARSR